MSSDLFGFSFTVILDGMQDILNIMRLWVYLNPMENVDIFVSAGSEPSWVQAARSN